MKPTLEPSSVRKKLPAMYERVPLGPDACPTLSRTIAAACVGFHTAAVRATPVAPAAVPRNLRRDVVRSSSMPIPSTGLTADRRDSSTVGRADKTHEPKRQAQLGELQRR